MNTTLTYSVTSLASKEINDKFIKAKTDFNLYLTQQKTREQNFILKNMAHITLKSKFLLKDPSQEPEVSEKLKDVTFPSIEVYASDIDIFISKQFGNILVVKVAKNNELQKLHEEIGSVLDSYIDHERSYPEREVFTPHLSILYYLPVEKIEQAKDYAQKNLLPITYSLSSFMLMKDVEGVKGERQLIRKYELSE